MIIDIPKIEAEHKLPNWLSPIVKGLPRLHEIVAKNRDKYLAEQKAKAEAKRAAKSPKTSGP